MFDKFFFLRLKRKFSSYAVVFRASFWILTIILVLAVSLFVVKVAAKAINLPVFYLTFLYTPRSQGLFQDQNHTNILVMGIGGNNHEGPTLTDSLILTSLNLEKKTISLITIPRDLWLPELGAKINTAYQDGENKKKGTGIILSKAAVSQVLGIPVHYSLVIDFSAFKKIVDLIGGVDIKVENTFTDSQYPLKGKENDLCGKSEEEIAKVTEENMAQVFPCRFEEVTFNQGVQHFNGDLALKFVRSRHAKDQEGTDFARSQRQLKLIEAIKQKVSQPQIFLNPSVFSRVFNDLRGDLDTDLNTEQLLFLGKYFSNINLSQISHLTIDLGTKDKPGPLINPSASSYGAWVLIPKKGNWEEIHSLVKSFLWQ